MENRYYPQYFEIYELIPREVFRLEDMRNKDKHMQPGWSYLDERLLITIDAIREIIGKPLICNTWFQDGNRENCGYRTSGCTIGALKSQHKLGRAVDLICPYMSAEEMRQKIKKDEDKLPFPIRIEDGVSWLHVDVKEMDYKGKKIYFFKA